jgi:hypothetical protein
MADLSHLTDCGLPGISRVPYGVHACHFYSNREQLVAALVPYFVAGLRANERCLWVTASPLPAREALRALEAAWPDAGEAVDTGALRILDYEQWYANSVGLKGLDVVQLWLDEEERALASGYSGLRITGNTCFLRLQDWPTFMEYERAVTERFGERRIVALCSYSLEKCSASQVAEVKGAHTCTFEHRDPNWQVARL